MTPFFIATFLKYLEFEKRFSKHTIIAYQTDLLQFSSYLKSQNFDNEYPVNSKIIRKWLVDLTELSVSNRTLNRKLTTLRTFFKWLEKEGEISVNPLIGVTSPKIKKRLPAFARQSELDLEKIETVFSDSLEGNRNKLIIEIFYQTGIRLSELIHLKKSDIQKNSIKVLGKRNKERIIPISKALYLQIEKYKNESKDLVMSTVYLFSLKNREKLYPKLVYRIINIYLGQVTSLDKCSPHVLRHTFATHMLNNGAGLEVLKDILGHANLSATQFYTHNSFEQLNSIYSLAHPRGQNKK